MAAANTVLAITLPSDFEILTSENSNDHLYFSSKDALNFQSRHSSDLDKFPQFDPKDKKTVKKQHILASEMLSITEINIKSCWKWSSDPKSRFSKVAEMVAPRRLKIEGKVSTEMLSKNTTYEAYLLYKINIKKAIKLENVKGSISYENKTGGELVNLFLSSGNDRSDGWKEVKLGQVHITDDGNAALKMLVRSEDIKNKKGGLIVEGIELRPLGSESINTNLNLKEFFLVSHAAASPTVDKTNPFPVLLDDGKMCFWIDEKNGKSCYSLGSKMLDIKHKDDTSHWKWITDPNSRFSVSAELISVQELDIKCNVECRLLSPEMKYSAYLVYKLTKKAKSLKSVVTKVKLFADINTGNENDYEDAEIDLSKWKKGYKDWRELSLGTYTNEVQNSDKFLKIRVWEEADDNIKSTGLIVDAIELRPN